MQRGTRLEGLARVAYQRAVGRAVAECGPYVSEKTPFLLASPDGVVVNTDGVHEGFVELKVTGSGEPAPITDSYLLQCVMHCYCGELLYCDFVSFGRDKLLVQRVTYDFARPRYRLPAAYLPPAPRGSGMIGSSSESRGRDDFYCIVVFSIYEFQFVTVASSSQYCAQ